MYNIIKETVYVEAAIWKCNDCKGFTHISDLLLPNLLYLLFESLFVLVILEILANVTDRISKKTLNYYICWTIRPKLHKKLVKLLIINLIINY